MLNPPNSDPAQMSPLALAFVGDAVYSLMTRQALATASTAKANSLHNRSAVFVSAAVQAKSVQRMLPQLTPDEENIYKRGRNAHTNHVPKGATVAEYHAATGLECLFGYLYLKGKLDRLEELFAICAADL